MRKLSTLSAVFLAALFVACAPKKIEPFSSLENKGLLALSSTNPYLGANLYIAKEAERSPLFRAFLEGRGGPTAMAINRPSRGAPEMEMYFAKNGERYTAYLENTHDSYEWIVSGPFPMDREEARELSRLEATTFGEPVFIVFSEKVRFHEVGNTKRVERIIMPVIPPTPAPTPKPSKVETKQMSEAPKNSSTREEIENFKPANADQEALRTAQGYAKRSPTGDVIHTTQHPAETIDMIARWYTGDAKNAAQLGIDNGFSDVNKAVGMGKTIVIPFKLLTNVKRMPLEFK